MLLIVNGAGGVSWDTTRVTAIADARFSGLVMQDFGAGPENKFTCPGCNRTLPTKCMHLDHIRAQSTYAVSFMQNGQVVTLVDAADVSRVSTHFGAVVEGGTVNVSKLGTTREAAKAKAVARAAIVGGGPIRVNPPRPSAASPYGAPSIGTATVIHTKDAWLNDLRNLQFLCMMCNTSKGDREFAAAFAGKAASPLAKALGL
jgi:5-methylcytosine-specific restriction endonuclease McrA